MTSPTFGDLLAAAPANVSLASSCSPPQLLINLSAAYQEAHKYLATILCSVGAATNLLNMVVFCQRSMRNPTNTLLTALALSDCLLSMSYLPFCLYFTMQNRLKQRCPEPYPWQLFLWIQVCLAIFAHSCSSWITVALAAFRLVYIELPVRSRRICTNRTSLLSIAIACVASAAMVAPNALEHHVTVAKPEDVRDRRLACRLDGNATYFEFELKFQNSVLSSLNFWIIGLGIKFLPVLLLTLLSVFLIRSLRRTHARRKVLRSGIASSSGVASETVAASQPVAAGGGQSETDRQTNRTTKILITIVLVSVASIWPQQLHGT